MCFQSISCWKFLVNFKDPYFSFYIDALKIKYCSLCICFTYGNFLWQCIRLQDIELLVYFHRLHRRHNSRTNSWEMFSLFYGLWKYMFSKMEFHVLILGIDKAGKTVLFQLLCFLCIFLYLLCSSGPLLLSSMIFYRYLNMLILSYAFLWFSWFR